MDRDLHLARLTFLKDLILAQFQAKVSKWKDVQAAALALAGLALMAFFTGALGGLALFTVLGVSAAAVMLSHAALERYERRARVQLGKVMADVERIKPGGRP